MHLNNIKMNFLEVKQIVNKSEYTHPSPRTCNCIINIDDIHIIKLIDGFDENNRCQITFKNGQEIYVLETYNELKNF